MIRRFFGVLALALCAGAIAACHPLAVSAAETAIAASPCPQFAYGGQPPEAPAAARAICYKAYGLGWSPASRDPVWSMEHLTAEGVKAALAARRAGDFHPEANLPKSERAELSDYRCAPYDRGHMTPVGDFGDPAEENDTFTLANMVPQDPALNEGLWAAIEGAVRDLAARDGEVWIVTGPMFAPSPAQLRGRVAIPAETWKAVYDPKIGALAYVAENDASGRYVVVTLAELADRLGWDPMPAVTGAERAVLPDAPRPNPPPRVLKPRSCKGR